MNPPEASPEPGTCTRKVNKAGPERKEKMEKRGAGNEGRQIHYWAHMLDEAFGVGPMVTVQHQVKIDDPFTISNLGGGDGYLNDYGGVRGALRELRRMTGGFDPDKTPVFCLAYTGENDADMYCVSMTTRGNPRTYEFLSRDKKAEGVFALVAPAAMCTASARDLTDMLDFTEKFAFTDRLGYDEYMKRPGDLPNRLVLGVTYKRGRQKQTWRMVEKIVYTKFENLDKVARVKDPEKYGRDDTLLLVVRDDRRGGGSFVTVDGTDLIKDDPVIPWRGRIPIRGW